MDSTRFDDLLRSFAHGLSRRATLGAALSSLLATGSLALIDDDAEAKKHKKKKRKKKKKGCQSGTKPCGTACIAATACCSSAECGEGSCVNGACTCDSGLLCNGECVTGEQCCQDNQCSAGQNCLDGSCICQGSNDIQCGDNCCDAGDDEVCNSADRTCEGGCVANDWCNGDDLFICALTESTSCVCLSTADPAPQTACVDWDAVFDDADCSSSCASSADCPSGSVCVPGNAEPDGFCACGTSNFCAPLCGQATLRSANQIESGPAVIDATAPKSGQRKRRRR